jgi:hypothetical protein
MNVMGDGRFRSDAFLSEIHLSAVFVLPPLRGAAAPMAQHGPNLEFGQIVLSRRKIWQLASRPPANSTRDGMGVCKETGDHGSSDGPAVG